MCFVAAQSTIMYDPSSKCTSLAADDRRSQNTNTAMSFFSRSSTSPSASPAASAERLNQVKESVKQQMALENAQELTSVRFRSGSALCVFVCCCSMLFSLQKMSDKCFQVRLRTCSREKEHARHDELNPLCLDSQMCVPSPSDKLQSREQT